MQMSHFVTKFRATALRKAGRLSKSALAAAVLLCVGTSTHAAVLISNLANPTGGFQNVSSAQALGQAFTVGSEFHAQITGATLRFNPVTTENLAASTVTLRDNTSGAVLGTFTRDTAFQGSTYFNYTYSLASPVTLLAGSEATIHLSTTGASFRWSDPATTSNTPNGLTHLYQYFGNAPAPVNLQRTGRMLSYSVEGNLVAVPEPASLSMLVIGAACLLRRRSKSDGGQATA
jgi:hypothetical protein